MTGTIKAARHEKRSVRTAPRTGPASAARAQTELLSAYADFWRCLGIRWTTTESGTASKKPAANPWATRRTASASIEGASGAIAVDDCATDRQADGEGGGITADDERVAVEAAKVASRARERSGDQQHVRGRNERRSARGGKQPTTTRRQEFAIRGGEPHQGGRP